MELKVSSRPSLIGRAFLALTLLSGFYGLALTLAAILLYIPYAQVVYAHLMLVGPTIFCLVSSVTILVSILPRRDIFTPPGPLLTSEEHPALYAVLREIAGATGQEMPHEVYCTMEVNAWVAERGGLMGFGGRRVMVLGLPLLQVFTTTQLRAILAHEFGHFSSGDTRLGTLVYKTRRAIDYTLQGLQGRTSLLQKPFLWYGSFFLKFTSVISRQQEFAADALMAMIVGSRSAVEGLRMISGAQGIFLIYWDIDVAPMLRKGFRPSILEGLRDTFALSETQETVNRYYEAELKEGKTDPYESHPPLRERIEAIARLPEGKSAGDDSLAISLLADPARLEQEVLSFLMPKGDYERLKPLRWADALEKFYLPEWAGLVSKGKATLPSLTTAGIPALARTTRPILQELRSRGGSSDKKTQDCLSVVLGAGAALALALRERGWSVVASPGIPIICKRNGTEIKPFDLIQSLCVGTQSEEEYLKICRDVGIADVTLWGEAQKAPSGTSEEGLPPELVYCVSCRAVALLNEGQRRAGVFTCPNCGRAVKTAECEEVAPWTKFEIKCPSCHRLFQIGTQELKLKSHNCPGCGTAFEA